MDHNEVQKLHALGVSTDAAEVLKARGFSLLGLLKIVKAVIGAFEDSDLLKGSTTVTPAVSDKLKAFGMTDADLADYAAKGLDFSKILAFIMAVIDLIAKFKPTTPVPAE